MPATISQPGYGSAVQYNVTVGSDLLSLTGGLTDKSGVTLTVGSDAGQVNKAFSATFTLTSASPTLVDLTALLDAAGQTFGLSTVEVIKLANKSITVGEDVTVGGGTNGVFAALPFPLKASARADASILIATPITVDPTHKILQLTVPTGTAVTVLLTLLGR